MAVIENLDIVLGARTEKLDAGLDRSTGRVKKFEADVGGIGKAAEATLAPLRDIGLSILAAIPGASAAATAFAAIAAAFSGSAATKVARETRETALESSKAAAAMSGFATASVAGATAAARAATAAGFAAAVGSRVAGEARETAVATAAAATAMTVYARSAVVAAVAAGRINMPDLPRLGGPGGGGARGGGLALYNPATARAGAMGDGMGDVIDAEFTKITAASTQVGKTMSMLGPIGIAAGAAVAAGFVAAAVGVKALLVTTAGVREQMTAIDDVSDAAKKLGMTFEDLATARFALSESSGLDTSAIDNALQKMQLGLAEARSGSGALAGQLKALGLDAGKLLAAGPVDALNQISAATQQIKNPTDQLVLAYQLFGKQGAAMVSSLRDGPNVLNEAANAARSLGLTLTQTQAEQVGAANDAWGRVYLIADGAFRQIAAEVSPLLTAIAQQISTVAEGFGGWQAILPPIVDALAFGAGYLYDWVEAITATLTAWQKIKAGDFSGAAESMTAALDFGTGMDMVLKTQQARIEAAKTAGKSTVGDVDIAAIEAEAEARNQAAEAAKQAAAEREREATRNKEAVADRIGGLRDEVSVLGQASSAMERLKLSRQGATAAQLAEFDALNAAKAKHEELSSAMERGKEIAAQYRTPMEAFDSQIKDLNTLFQVGAIDFNTYARATRDAAKKAGGENDASKRLKDTPTISALQRGSVEAFSAANKNDKAATAVKLQEQGNKLLEQVNVNLENIARQRGQSMKGV